MSPSQEIIPVRIGLTTAYIVRDEAVILVDTGFAGSENTILSALGEHGISPEEVRLILLTHGHADHAGSAAALKQATGALVAAGHPELGRLRTGRSGKLVPTGLCGHLFRFYCSRDLFCRYPPVEPDILIDSYYDLKVHGVHGYVIPTPGHTAGSVSVLLESGDAIAGDLMYASFPFGSPAVPFFVEDTCAWKRSVGLVMEKTSGRVYIAHGGPFDAETIRQHLSYQE